MMKDPAFREGYAPGLQLLHEELCLNVGIVGKVDGEEENVGITDDARNPAVR
ncbi:MAG: hypothetical protein MZV70_02175 [Desulfobacterales bacterium]|nr:hypothetical protein [Desulfobacterales bacterium]